MQILLILLMPVVTSLIFPIIFLEYVSILLKKHCRNTDTCTANIWPSLAWRGAGKPNFKHPCSDLSKIGVRFLNEKPCKNPPKKLAGPFSKKMPFQFLFWK